MSIEATLIKMSIELIGKDVRKNVKTAIRDCIDAYKSDHKGADQLLAIIDIFHYVIRDTVRHGWSNSTSHDLVTYMYDEMKNTVSSMSDIPTTRQNLTKDEKEMMADLILCSLCEYTMASVNNDVTVFRNTINSLINDHIEHRAEINIDSFLARLADLSIALWGDKVERGFDMVRAQYFMIMHTGIILSTPDLSVLF